MLIDAGGRLRGIDNERLIVEPAGLDLGRTFDRAAKMCPSRPDGETMSDLVIATP